MNRWTIGSLLETAAGYLREKGSESAKLDAELLLAEVLDLERIQLYTEYDRPLASREIDAYRRLIARRARHEPVAYILGRASFRHLVLEVTPAVLIPRPETEELVDLAIQTLRLKPPWEALSGTDEAAPGGDAPAGSSPAPLIADVGTGSGAVALSLAQETGLRVLATDASADALAVAARNRETLGLEPQVELRCVDLLSDVPRHSLRMVVCNPPYVRSGDMDSLPADVRLFEPVEALEAGSDGLSVFRRLLPQAAQALMPGGTVLLEVGDGQAAAVVDLARQAGFCLQEVHKDLSQKDRMVAATLPGSAVATLGDLNAAQMKALASALEVGAVVGLPTDTVYGIGARWDSQPGVRRLVSAKGRDAERPVAVLFSSAAAIQEAVPDLDATAGAVLAALLPGPFTFVVGTSVPRPQLVGTVDSLGVRIPDHPSLLELISSLETALAATSANPTGQAEAAALLDVDPVLLAHCAIAFEPRDPESRPGLGSQAGVAEASLGPASTVVDLRPLAEGRPAVVLREGAVRGARVLERIAGLL